MAPCPPEDWRTKQVIAFDWYDGPTAGLCELERPRCCFRFDILGQRFDDTFADRLFRLSEAPLDAVEQALAALADLGPPQRPIWAPVWRFSSDEAKQEAEQTIEQILTNVTPTPIILRALEMDRFPGYWVDVSDTPPEPHDEAVPRPR